MNEPSTKKLELQSEKIVVDWLIYRSYAFNRDRRPEIKPERWRKIYFNAEIYEKIYQEEKQCLN